MKKKLFATGTALALAAALAAMPPMGALADAPPDMPSGGGSFGGGEAPGGASGGGSSSSDISWSGATTITSAETRENETFSSTSADENAVLVNTDEAVTLANPTVEKSGGTSASDNYSFYGINSAIMAKGGGTTTITGGTVKTEAAGANGVFSYGANNGSTNAVGDNTTVKISDTTITTTEQGSGGIMTTYGGTTIANNLTVTTSGGSSAPIRTDRGGGWVYVTGGSYTSNGQGSPAIYSTAAINVSDATLVSNKSEGVCIEGVGSIALSNCDLTANNTALNGNATFYDTIMIYQSQSGDASDGTSSFSMTDGSLTSQNGDTFHVTNTTANINLENVTITNSDSGALISVCDDGWSGASNIATLNATRQTLNGDVLVGSDSTLTMNLSDTSLFTGKTSGEITNGNGSSVSSSIGTVNMTLGSDSLWVLTGDCTVSSLSGDGKINYNGHVLTVGSTTYSSGQNIGDITETSETTVTRSAASATSTSSAVTTFAPESSGSSDSSSIDTSGASAIPASSADASGTGASSTDASGTSAAPASSADASGTSAVPVSSADTSGTSAAPVSSADVNGANASSAPSSPSTAPATTTAPVSTTQPTASPSTDEGSSSQKVKLTVKKGSKNVSAVNVKTGKSVVLTIKTTPSNAKVKLAALSGKNKKIASVTLKGKKLTIKGKKKGTFKISLNGTASGKKKVTKKIKITISK